MSTFFLNRLCKKFYFYFTWNNFQGKTISGKNTTEFIGNSFSVTQEEIYKLEWSTINVKKVCFIAKTKWLLYCCMLTLHYRIWIFVLDGHCLITKLSSVVSAEIEIKGEKIGERKKFRWNIKDASLFLTCLILVVHHECHLQWGHQILLPGERIRLVIH